MATKTLLFRRIPLGAALGALAAALVSGAGAQAGKPAARPAGKKPAETEQAQKVQFGDTIITAEQIDYDLEKKQYVFTVKVDLVSKNSHMTADKMTVQLNAENALQWSKCEGNVNIDKKNPEDGSTMTGRARMLDYNEVEQKANLAGDVVVHQSSPRLAKPAIITGARVDMDLKGKKNVVHRSPESQAKVHLEPKGEDGRAAPEPADLIGDQIVQDDAQQEYVATGQPVMVRPSTKLRAKTIRFKVDEKTNEINVAHAEEDVIYDGQSETGSVIHCTGDRGTYNKEASEMVMEGRPDDGGTVHATIKEPDDEKPTVYQGVKFIYNSKTGGRRLVGQPARIIIPEKPKKPMPAGTGAAPGTETPKPGKGNEKSQ